MAPRPEDLAIARRVGAQLAEPGIYNAQLADPAKAGRANEMGRRLGIPADIVEADLPGMEAEDRLRRARLLARGIPAYARMMGNPRFAAAAIDDKAVPDVARSVAAAQDAAARAQRMRGRFDAIDRDREQRRLASQSWAGREDVGTMQYPSQLVAAVVRRIYGVSGGFGRFLSSTANAAGWEGGARYFAQRSRRNEAIASFTPKSSMLSTWQDVKRNPLLAPQFGVEQLTSSTFDMAALIAALPVYIAARSGEIGQQRAQNNGKEDASLGDVVKAAPAATISAFLERFGLKGIGTAIANPALRTALMAATREAGTEFLQSGIEYTAATAGTNKGWDGWEMVDQMAAGAVGGFFGGGIFGGGGGAINHGLSKVYEARASRAAAETVDHVMEAASRSETRTLNPTDFEEVLNQQLEGRPGESIYIPAEQVATLFQESDIREHAFWGQFAAQFEEATAIGGDLVIPLATAATHLAGTPEWQALREHVRATPGGASIAEAKQRQTPEELEALATQLAEEIERRVPQWQAMKAVEKFAADLGYEGEQARAVSQLVSARLAVATQAENRKREARGEAPIKPAEMWAKWGLSAEKTTQAEFEGRTAAKAEGPFSAKATNGGFHAVDAAGRTLVPKDHQSGAAPKRFRTEAAAIKAAPKMVPLETTFGQELGGNISLARDERGAVSRAVIRAFEGANFSTAVHELGHFWLEDLRARATSPEAAGQERADWEAVKQWFTENGHEAGETVPVEAHEMWARGMERYIFEGKAPSKGLKAVFAQMRDWMMEVYRSVVSFNSPITPEIREVMDRLFASEEEIEIQRQELSLAAAHLDELMTEAERTDYQRASEEVRGEAREKLMERILSTLRRERTEEAIARRRVIQEEVRTFVDDLPAFKALRTLRVGIEQDEGEPVKARLSRQWLVEVYGDEILGRLPKGIQPLYADSDMIDADQLAEMAGFSSADEMVNALVEMEAQRQAMKAAGDRRSPRQAAIEEAATARIRDEIGDPLVDIEEEAQAVLASERQADLMSLELRALARKTGQRPTPAQVARDWARDRVAAARIRDALSGSALQMYGRNAGKAGQSAEEALIKGDFEEAFRFKQQQMLNLALLSEAKKAKDKAEKAVRRLQKVAAKKTMASVDQDYLDQAHQLLEGVEMKTRPLTQVDRRRAFETWYADQVAQGREPIVPVEYQRSLGQTNWQQLTVSELLELDDVVSQVVQLGRLKQRLRDGKEERDFAEVRAEAVAQLASLRQLPRSRRMDEGRSGWLTLKTWTRRADAALVKIEVLCDWMDGRDSNGLFNRLVFKPLADAQGRKTRMVADYAARLDAIIAAVPPAQVRRWEQTVDTPELVDRETGDPFDDRTEMQRLLGRGETGLTRGGVIMMALNWGNDGNRQRLADGYGWAPEAVQAVLDRVMTKEDWNFVQSVWAEIDTLGPELFELERRVNGVAPEKVEGTTVVTPFGSFKGGYFPAVYDPSKDRAPQRPREQDLFTGDYQRATTRAAAANERSARVSRPLLLNLSVINRHIEEVIHDITHREAVIAVDRLTSDPAIQKAIAEAFGPEYAALFRPWLKQIANEPSGGGAAKSKVDAHIQGAFRAIRTRVTMVGLGFRLGSALAQIAGTPNIIGEIGAARFAQGVTQLLAHPVSNSFSGQSLYRIVTEKSGEMAGRFANMDRDVRENLRLHAQRSGPLAPVRFIQRHAYDLILAMDMLITLPGWMGAYEKALSEGMAEEEAVYYADKVIRVSQGAGGAKDQAAVMTNHEATRFFTLFFSYFSSLYNRQRDIFRMYGESVRERDMAKALEAARRTFWIMLLPPILDAAIRGQEAPDDDEDGEKSWAETGRWLLRKVTFGNLASLPGVRDIGGALDSGFGYKVTPVQGIGETFIKALGDVDDLTDEDAEPSSIRIKRAFIMLGYIAKLPTGYLGQQVQYGADVYAGDQEAPDTLGEAYMAATKGKVEAE